MKVSVTEQLAQLKLDAAAEAVAAKQKIEQLEKAVESAKSTNGYHQTQAKDALEELNQAHALLDALPNAIPRKAPPTEYGHPCRHARRDCVLLLMAVFGRWSLARNRVRQRIQ